MDSDVRLAAVRSEMKKRGFSAWIVPSGDPHQSEYVADRWRGRAWLSGFTGSAGTVVVTPDKAGLWTDGRYFLQAEQELAGSGITLFKMGEPDVPELSDWLAETLAAGDVAAMAGETVSVRQFESIRDRLKKASVELKSSEDILDSVWTDRPEFPSAPIEVYPLEYAGVSRVEKLNDLRTEMKQSGVDAHLFASLDDIAWLFNIRGGDVCCNPVVMSFALVTADSAFLFVHEHKVSDAVRKELAQDGVTVRPYEAVYDVLTELPNQSSVLIDPDRTSVALLHGVPDSVSVIRKRNLTQLPKALKNEAESAGMRKAHLLDGIAVSRFLCWLEQAVKEQSLTEVDAADKLAEFRELSEEYEGPSFETISGYAANGAIIHYTAEPGTAATLKPEGLYLVDSGGQYRFGTTDITRTIALGPVSDEARRDFTLVLKGHIAVASLQFPSSVAGTHIDAFARKALWDFGLDYKHGTGHGIGAKLNVHEGPHGISPRWLPEKLQPGMMISNEPGFYRAGQYGIRIESIVEVAPTEDFEGFYAFDTITVCPIDSRLVLDGLLSEPEKEWLNSYNNWCFDLLLPHMETEEEREWLARVCEEVL